MSVDGLVSMGQFSDSMYILNTHDMKTATHVLRAA